jgi:hypothetical protein
VQHSAYFRVQEKQASPAAWAHSFKLARFPVIQLKRIATLAVLAIPFVLAGCSHPQPVAYAPPPPPAEFGPAAQQGYHDGILAARRDIGGSLAPDLQRHPRFRNPPVGPPEEYRRGFRAGYNATLRGGSPPPPGY